MKRSLLFRIGDLLLLPLIYPAGIILKLVRRAGVSRLPYCKRALLQVGVFPLRNHYYEPQFDFREESAPPTPKRDLPGIDWNTKEQLALLNQFNFTHELANIPSYPRNALEFHFNNGAFESGDAEFLYQLIRLKMPRQIIEIGSGYSTLMAIKAIHKNMSEASTYSCEHVCIEPYEMPWLETAPVSVVREKVENLNPSFFSCLGENDILFIDSSHIIRPFGDVLYEYLQILPCLNPGVIVHIHDIFSPNNYPTNWIRDDVKFWNEQYLLEAFLTHNNDWKIIGALGYIKANHFDALKGIAPSMIPSTLPG